MKPYNISNSIFPDFNDRNGLMICGYEWGWSKDDEADYENGEYVLPETEVPHTFANKALHYGKRAKTWPYDRNIRKWFELWGHPMDENGLGGAFEQSMLQTNWADTQGRSVNEYEKFLSKEQVGNFIRHIEVFRPKLILFMGSRLLSYLNNPAVLPHFQQIAGKEVEPLKYTQKMFDKGTRFKVGFQKFENCQVVCLPHPSASRGLSHEYIGLFKPEMDKILTTYKTERDF